jgi:hypothetical protein
MFHTKREKMKKDQKIKPYVFYARQKPFLIEIDLKQGMVVKGISKGDYLFRFTRPVPVKEGDVIKGAKHGLMLNGTLVPRRIIQPKGKVTPKVAWVAKRLRVAIFPDRDRLYDHKKKKFLNKWGTPYWTACDVRSYQIGCADTMVEALRDLIESCVMTNLLAEDERKKNPKVIRWRCLLTKDEVEEMECKARRKGIILDGVEVPSKCDWLK